MRLYAVNLKDRAEQNDLLRYIANTPALLSLLYDGDLLPEQLLEGSRDWGRMLLIAGAWRAEQRRNEPVNLIES